MKTDTSETHLDEPQYENCTATRNACKLCTPLGACLAFRGINGCIPFLHGSQGCSTYIRRYLISHFREPVDIAASNFSEDSAVFGGEENFKVGAANVVSQYQPAVLGVATTCLSETIGEDMRGIIHRYLGEVDEKQHAPVVHVSTPSYTGSHIDGYHATVLAVAEQLAEGGERRETVNVFPGMVSPEDLRYIKEVLSDFHLYYTLLPDYSDSLDGSSWSEYEKLPQGGTLLEDIRGMGRAKTSLEFGRGVAAMKNSAGRHLEQRFGVSCLAAGLPIGLRETDALFSYLEAVSGLPTPEKYQGERGRLVDSYVDGHKYVFGKRAIVYGEEDLVIGLTSMLAEAGIHPMLCVSGGRSGNFEELLREAVPNLPEDAVVKDGADFSDLGGLASELKPDLLVGNSKGYKIARKLDIPLVRVGFPVHDRMGAQRILSLGYRGAQQLYDRIVNALLEQKQRRSDMGYSYL